MFWMILSYSVGAKCMYIYIEEYRYVDKHMKLGLSLKDAAESARRTVASRAGSLLSLPCIILKFSP